MSDSECPSISGWWMIFALEKSQLVLPWFFRAILGLRHLKPLEFHSRMRHGFTLLKLAQWPQVRLYWSPPRWSFSQGLSRKGFPHQGSTFSLGKIMELNWIGFLLWNPWRVFENAVPNCEVWRSISSSNLLVLWLFQWDSPSFSFTFPIEMATIWVYPRFSGTKPMTPLGPKLFQASRIANFVYHREDPCLQAHGWLIASIFHFFSRCQCEISTALLRFDHQTSNQLWWSYLLVIKHG